MMCKLGREVKETTQIEKLFSSFLLLFFYCSFSLTLLLFSVFVFALFLPFPFVLCLLLDDHLEVPLRQIRIRQSHRGMTYKATKYSLGLI